LPLNLVCTLSFKNNLTIRQIGLILQKEIASRCPTPKAMTSPPMLLLNFTPFPILYTDRLILRQLKTEDAEAIVQLRKDASMHQYSGNRKAQSIEEIRTFIADINQSIKDNTELFWSIELKSEQAVIGTFCLWNIEQYKRTGEIGYQILPAYQGQGLMQEAMDCVLAYFFAVLKIDIIEAFTMPNNHKSTRLLTKSNFKRNIAREAEIGQERMDGDAVYALESSSFMMRG